MKIIYRVLRFVVTLLEVLFVYQLFVRLVRRQLKFPAPAFIGKFLDSGLRRRIQPPQRVIGRSGIQPGMTVLEIGCGSGAFTTDVARALGARGKVYALDVQPEMLDQLRQKLDRSENMDIDNIHLVNESAYNLPFEYESIDLVYMVAAFQEIPDQQSVLNEVKRVLKRGGILAITEFMVDPDYPQITTTLRACKQAGFAIDDVPGNYFDYTVRAIKP